MSASLVLAFLAAAAIPGDWYVDANDPGCASGTGGPTDPFCEIFTAIQAASPGDTIHVAPGDYAEILVDRDLTILGTGGSAVTTIRPWFKGLSLVEVLAGVTVVMDGFTLRDGKGSDPYYGGGTGGGIYNAGTLTLTDAVITNNATAVAGGGIDNQGTLFLSDAVISANRTAGLIGFGMNSGGGLRNFGTATLTDVTVTGNSGYDSGGGIDNAGTLVMDDCTVDGNVANGYGDYGVDAAGGGIYNTGSLTVEDTTISDNRTDSGNYPGTDGGGGLANIGGVAVLTRCLVEDNDVDGWSPDGGGILNTGKNVDLTLVDCTIRRNTAKAYYAWTGGGGLYNRGRFTAVRCVISGNSAHSSGGVGDASGYQGTMIGCLISQNSASLGGGGGVGASGTTFDHCTIAGNSAASGGGGIAANPSTNFTHTIVASNSAVTGPDIAGTIDSLGYNLVGDTTDATITGDPTGNLLDVSPQFGGPSYRLSGTSPCIDAGDPARTPLDMDLDNNPRWLDGDLDGVQVVDMGACEYDHVNLLVTGKAIPGGTLTFTSTGTPGLRLFLVVSTGVKVLPFPHFGALYPDLGGAWDLWPMGTIPDTRSFTVPPAIPTPLPLWMQEIAVLAAGVGNTSNPVVRTIQ